MRHISPWPGTIPALIMVAGMCVLLIMELLAFWEIGPVFNFIEALRK